MEHRAAARHRKSVAVAVDHIDIGGALRNPLGKQFRALVDQSQDAARNDLFIVDRPAPEADLARM